VCETQNTMECAFGNACQFMRFNNILMLKCVLMIWNKHIA
jgi:hypothetical protein